MTPSPTPTENVRRNLRTLRTGRGWSCEELGRRIHVAGGNLNRVALSKIENGRRGVDVDELFELAAAFDVSVASLAGGPACKACADSPPAGYACLACGRRGDEGGGQL